ncbi:MAG: sensor domain-containing diguanylate cyclase [candidate division Zixibacteria bacterium]
MIFASKVKKIYPNLKGILLAAGFVWCFSAYIPPDSRRHVLYVLLIYAFILMLFSLLKRKQIFLVDNLNFVSQFFDALVIAAIIRYTGGFYSDFYLAFFPVVALASVFCERWRSVVGALWYGVCFLLAIYGSSPLLDNWQTVMFRLISIWSVGLVSFSVAYFMRSSEKKLLKTLDMLNERTWELESSQSQISNIYETSRVLSGILDLEHLLQEILNVAQKIFRLKTCRIFLANAAGDGLDLYAGLENGNRHIYENPIPHKKDINGFSGKTGKESPMISANNAKDGDTGKVDIPLLSRGNVIGVMQVSSETGTLPVGKDKRFLIVFAGAVSVAIDNSLLHKKTEELTIIDALTGLHNYRFFRYKLADELRRADRYRQKLSVLMMDLDHFKDINDRYGHQTGNAILREISGIIMHCVRDIDVVARYGGEEFVVILPQTEEEEAGVIAERIRDTIEKNEFADSQGQREIRITISIGITVYPEGVRTLNQLIEKVDKALYRAKADGRNVVRVAEKTKRRTVDIN